MFETAISGYGYGTQQVGPQGPYFGQPPFGGPAGGMAQPIGGYPAGAPQSLLPLTIGPGAVPFQQIYPRFGQPQFGQQQLGQPQLGPLQFGQPQFGQPQFGIQQLGLTQPPIQPIQVIPVVTPQGWFGLLLLATGQPLVIGVTAGGISGGLGQYPGYGWGAPQGMIGGYLPLQAQQQVPQIPQMYQPVTPFGAPTFPGQPLGGMPIH
jgi:hypothetical protein